MHLVGLNAKLLRDQFGNNLYVTTNLYDLGGGESFGFILDSAECPGHLLSKYLHNLTI